MLRVRSDKGTSIQIMLPCATQPVTATGGHTAARVRHAEVQTQPAGTILVVEDEVPLLLAVSKLLQRRGFSVIQASNGSSALELIRNVEKHIDAMLLDVTLPGVSSREVWEETRRLRPDLLAILTSAYSRENVTASLGGLAVENFIRKPFHVEDLVSLLQDSPSLRTS